VTLGKTVTLRVSPPQHVDRSPVSARTGLEIEKARISHYLGEEVYAGVSFPVDIVKCYLTYGDIGQITRAWSQREINLNLVFRFFH
jgi:hypothetical protein